MHMSEKLVQLLQDTVDLPFPIFQKTHRPYGYENGEYRCGKIIEHVGEPSERA